MTIKTTVGIKNRLYKNDISCTNNTTLGFGIPQPLYMRTLLKKGHSVQAQIKQFLRLAPMPYPTLADIRLKNVVRFVPDKDIISEGAETFPSVMLHSEIFVSEH